MLDDKTVEVSSNGKRFARFSLVAIGSISSIVTVVVATGGFISGYMLATSKMATLTEQLESIRIDNKMVVSRQDAMTNSITILEQETKYISQGVAELKLANVPKH